jgi:hypothetical protein
MMETVLDIAANVCGAITEEIELICCLLIDGATRFSVAIRAESIRRAVDIVGRRYPGRNVRANFPLDPERFFVKNPTARQQCRD